MPAFTYRDGALHAESVPLEDIAAKYGTPCYVYSRAALESAYREFTQGCAGRDCLVCYAVKANSNLAVLEVFARLGAGFDIVSGGELFRVVKAGGDPRTHGIGHLVDDVLRRLLLDLVEVLQHQDGDGVLRGRQQIGIVVGHGLPEHQVRHVLARSINIRISKCLLHISPPLSRSPPPSSGPSPVWHGVIDGVAIAAQVRPVLNGVRLAHQGMSGTFRVLTEREAELDALMPPKLEADSGKHLVDRFCALRVASRKWTLGRNR